MISRITNNLTRFFSTPDGEVAYHKYEQMMKTDGFKIHKAFLTEIANGLLLYMVSKKYTDLDSSQKDVEQRAIFECKELIDFLLNPTEGLKRHNIMAAHNKRMERTVKGGPSK
ncbi:MAG: hypothetical protein ACYTFW_00800 [Planctomycetota bacterium]